MRLSSCLLLLSAPGWAAIWPDQIPPFFRTSAGPVSFTSDLAVWEEYGFDEGERAVYEAAGKKYFATAWRFRDGTSSMAAYQWMRPEGAEPAQIVSMGVTSGGGLLMVYGNYVLEWRQHMPTEAELRFVFDRLPRLEESPRPVFVDFFPSRGRIDNSERYILGPASLAKFEPRISPSMLGFHYGSEAQYGRFRIDGKELSLLLINYPTPNIARERLPEFQKLAGALVKRAGPLLAVVLPPADADAAEKLLANVRYRATISWTETVSNETELQRLTRFILNVFIFIGLLVLFAALSGAAVAGTRRLLARSGGQSGEGESMILLDLREK